MDTPAQSSSRNPALVLLHGAVLNGRMWDPVAAELMADFEILTPDLPGHGSRMGEPFRLAAAVTIVRDLVSSLAPAPVVLVGDSLGGYVSLASASTLGGRLKGAVLGGCTANFQGPASVPYAAQIGLTKLVPPAKLQTRLEQRIPKDYAAGAAILKGGIRPAAFAEAVAELKRVSFRAELAGLEVPILFVNGARDWLHRLGERGTLAAARNATLHRIPDVGHGVSILRPLIFAALIREFVAAHRLGPA
ncbi:MAG: alpha/beta hydrolase [Gemmatimonadota bacterium]